VPGKRHGTRPQKGQRLEQEIVRRGSVPASKHAGGHSSPVGGIECGEAHPSVVAARGQRRHTLLVRRKSRLLLYRGSSRVGPPYPVEHGDHPSVPSVVVERRKRGKYLLVGISISDGM